GDHGQETIAAIVGKDQQSTDVILDKGVKERLLTLTDLPNDLSVWCIDGAMEETLFVYKEVFEAGTYFQHRIALGEGDTVWDVGANIGLFSIQSELSVDTPDSLHLFAFEPIPVTREALRRNLDM
ncbi:unnamed protein product, partial [Choristocarpus tenellus]